MAELPEDLDTFYNETIVTGSLFMLLHMSTGMALRSVNLGPTGNQLDITLAFMKSTYRLSVEMVPETARPDEESP